MSTYVTDLTPDLRDTDHAETATFDDALADVLTEVERLPLRDRPAFLAEQSDEVREAALACIAVRGGDCVDAAEQMRDDFAALRRVPLPDWRDPRVA